jgi:hypothetical protein
MFNKLRKLRDELIFADTKSKDFVSTDFTRALYNAGASLILWLDFEDLRSDRQKLAQAGVKFVEVDKLECDKPQPLIVSIEAVVKYCP